MADHYSTLGVPRSADQMTIRAAYRDLARHSHPDAGGDAVTMARLNDAWNVLSQPDRRAAYDAELRASEQVVGRAIPVRRRAQDGHTILDFGRYAGWSLMNVGAVDDDYLVWLSRTPTGRTLQAEITQILDERARAVEAQRTPVAATRRKGWLG
jgi:curved DNA-binding protein CbpA